MTLLDGKKISQLERKSALGPDDSLLISRNYNEATENQFSKQVRMRTLVDDIVDELSSNVFISEMGYRETGDFSRKNHGHDYSNVKVYARPKSFLEQFSDSGECVRIADFQLSNHGKASRIEMFCPVQNCQTKEQPRIGELKFFMLDKLNPVDIDSSDFDGWVYPDGATYQKSRFPEAWAAFNSGPSTTTFRVPTLDRFIKPNPFAYQSNSLAAQPARVAAIPAHTHQIDLDQSKVQNIQLKIPVGLPSSVEDSGGSASKKHALHEVNRPYNDDKVQSSQYKVGIKSFSMTTQGGQLDSPKDPSETCPTHNLLPVKIYIGGVR